MLALHGDVGDSLPSLVHVLRDVKGAHYRTRGIHSTLVQNGTAGGNGTAGVTLNQPVLGFLVRMKPPRHFVL